MPKSLFRKNLLSSFLLVEGGLHLVVGNHLLFEDVSTGLRRFYHLDDLAVFREQYQNVCSRLITSGSFPTLQMQNCMDAYGNWYDAVHIDVIEDVGNTFIIQSVFVTPAYTEYKHQLQLNQQDMTANMSVPDATWKS